MQENYSAVGRAVVMALSGTVRLACGDSDDACGENLDKGNPMDYH